MAHHNDRDEVLSMVRLEHVYEKFIHPVASMRHTLETYFWKPIVWHLYVSHLYAFWKLLLGARRRFVDVATEESADGEIQSALAHWKVPP